MPADRPCHADPDPTGPVHDHDGTCCVFLGTTGPAPGERRVNAVDQYLCRGPSSLNPIRRYGSTPGDYACVTDGLVSGLRPNWHGTVQAALARGLIGADEAARLIHSSDQTRRGRAA